MISEFKGRRPLLARDYVLLIEDGPKLWNHVSKVWQNETNEKLDVKKLVFSL